MTYRESVKQDEIDEQSRPQNIEDLLIELNVFVDEIDTGHHQVLSSPLGAYDGDILTVEELEGEFDVAELLEENQSIGHNGLIEQF